MVLVGEEDRELGRQVGVLCQERGTINGVACFERLEIGRDDIVEPLVARRAERSRRARMNAWGLRP